MAKDGTNRGGARIGAGAKKKALADKIAEGNPGKRNITVIQFDNAADLEGREMPKPSEMLSAVQKDGKPLIAAEIYEKTWAWLHERGCASLISPQVLERYAMSADGVRLPGKAPYDRECDAESVCCYGAKLYGPDQQAMDGNFSGCEREL